MENLIFIVSVILVTLYAGSAFFSASETTLITLSRHKLRTLQEEHPDKAAAIEKWINNPNRLLTTMLIGINLLNIFSAIITQDIAQYVVEKWSLPSWVSTVFSLGFVSFMVIIFCEIVPKIMAYQSADKFVLKIIKPLMFFDRVLSPVVYVMIGMGNIVIKMLGGEPGAPQRAMVTEGEIISLVERGEKQGIIEKDEREMITNIFEFGETQVREVMVPRPDMKCAPATKTVAELAQMIEEASHSRIPIYEENEDNIIGIINSKAILIALKEGRDHERAGGFLHKVYFVPESKLVLDLMKEFQTMHIQLAIVVDEYGTTAGLVTLEDLLEEIVGEIRDEFDTEEPLYRWLNDATLRVDARISVFDLNELLDASMPEDDSYESLGGLIFHTLGKVPRMGESLSIGEFELHVEKMVGRRITNVLIKRLEPKAEDGQAEEKENEKNNS